MRKLTAVLATALIFAPSGAAGATDVEPWFAPSATGCPTFWEVDGGAGPLGIQSGDIDPSAGPLGTAQLHVTGFGFAVDGDDITATIRVVDMQRRVVPGSNRSYWFAGFGSKFLDADYDLVSDSFIFRWIDLDTRTSGPATGSVVPGPGGGLLITAKMADLGIGPGYEADTTRAFAGWQVALEVPGAVGAYPASSWSSAVGPELVPLVPCPGLSLRARLDPRIKGGVVATGITLPKVGGQPVQLQLLDSTEGWTTIATGTSGEDGAFEITGTAPSGSVSLRGVVSAAAGVGTSTPVQLKVP
jgi:hypothetical protein